MSIRILTLSTNSLNQLLRYCDKGELKWQLVEIAKTMKIVMQTKR